MGCTNSVQPMPLDNKGAKKAPKIETISAEIGYAMDNTGLQFRDATELGAGAQLLAATKKGDILAIHQLLKLMGPSGVNYKGMWGSTPLITAAQYGQSDASLALLEYSKDINVTICNERGASAMLYTCLEQPGEEQAPAVEVVRRMISICPEILKTTSFLVPAELHNPICDMKGRWTPLSAVCANNLLDIWKVLIAAGCPDNGLCCQVYRGESSDPKNIAGTSLSAYDTNLCNDTIVGITVPCGPRKVITLRQATPLMVACAYGRSAFIDAIISSNCKDDPNSAHYKSCKIFYASRDEHGSSVFHHAARGLHPEPALIALSRLLAAPLESDTAPLPSSERGSEILSAAMCIDCEGYSALHYLCHGGKANSKAARLLLCSVGACREASEGNTVGAVAIATTQNKDIHAWINAGSVSVSKGIRAAVLPYAAGTTALHIAVVKKAVDICEALLQAGANPHLADSRGLSPLEIARKNAGNGRSEDIQVLNLLCTVPALHCSADGSSVTAPDGTNSEPTSALSETHNRFKTPVKVHQDLGALHLQDIEAQPTEATKLHSPRAPEAA